jgi:hypothetical protein
MRFDPDIIQAVLFSVTRREPSVLAQHDKAGISKYKKLLLEHEFASGDETTRPNLENRTAVSSCSIDSLTVDGWSLHDLSSNESAWKRAKEGYAEEGYSWSLPEFHAFLKKQARRERQITPS